MRGVLQEKRKKNSTKLLAAQGLLEIEQHHATLQPAPICPGNSRPDRSSGARIILAFYVHTEQICARKTGSEPVRDTP